MKKALYISLMLATCLFMSTYVFAKETIKVGLITPLSGDVKTYGESVKNAFNMALEEYAKKGKYKIEPIIADDRNDPTEGANAALKLITQDRVVAIIGPVTSKVAIPVSEIANGNRIPMISGTATNPKVTISEGKRKPYVFRACYIDPFQGTIGARFVSKQIKQKTAAVLYDVGNDYSKGLAEYFKSTFTKGGGVVVAYESYQKDDVDFSGIITKVGTKKPDVIYIPDYYNKVALIAKQIREKGLKGVLVGGDGWDSPELLKIGGKAVVGGYFTNHYSPDRKDPVAEAFIKKYKARYGVVPDTFAALKYDATMIFLKALDGAKKPNSQEIVKLLGALKNYKGVTGNMSFDRNGDAVKSVVILKVEKGGFKYMATVNP
ncbi:ABC transporter substrate-binding protein [Syntrophorhabdus aromaticivorans]|uniref:ABC transporter substrate-binding protein n=1 Tax=Syntrophorhabdus aromaticivorans TaxID=328301 RepID=A0A971M135_9BACT|nr:ABC transporter substrate-binding protein [Syntrophorhabdus aromaticivorans]NLW33895.1 ABC transporter substrate-binding protein [Syntrophorhabdus aromaticivorans]